MIAGRVTREIIMENGTKATVPNELSHCKKCGWSGKTLKLAGCVTHGDKWCVCPQCGACPHYIDWAS